MPWIHLFVLGPSANVKSVSLQSAGGCGGCG